MPIKKYPQLLVSRAAKLTGKTKNTIRRWAKAGINLADDEQLLSWNKERGHNSGVTLPRKPHKSFHLKILDRVPGPGEEGAAAALKRLQGLERIFYSRLIGELSATESQPDYVTASQRDYDRITESLRKYEKEVELARRDLGHLIPKQEAQDGARAAALWMRLAWRMWLSSSLPDIFSLANDARAAKAKAEVTFHDILAVALERSKDAQFKIPDWAMSVIKEEFHLN